jgi:hypothetical protein
MDWKEAEQFLDNFNGVTNYVDLSAKDKREIHDLQMKQWDVESWDAESPEDQAKKERLLQNIVDYKKQRWG